MAFLCDNLRCYRPLHIWISDPSVFFVVYHIVYSFGHDHPFSIAIYADTIMHTWATLLFLFWYQWRLVLTDFSCWRLCCCRFLVVIHVITVVYCWKSCFYQAPYSTKVALGYCNSLESEWYNAHYRICCLRQQVWDNIDAGCAAQASCENLK